MNSTWGLLGASDVAAYAGIKYEKMSFGKSTLKVMVLNLVHI